MNFLEIFEVRGHSPGLSPTGPSKGHRWDLFTFSLTIGASHRWQREAYTRHGRPSSRSGPTSLRMWTLTRRPPLHRCQWLRYIPPESLIAMSKRSRLTGGVFVLDKSWNFVVRKQHDFLLMLEKPTKFLWEPNLSCQFVFLYNFYVHTLTIFQHEIFSWDIC